MKISQILLATYKTTIYIPPTTNWARDINGGTATASSNPGGAGFAPSTAINGVRDAQQWGNGGGWYSSSALPQWLQVSLVSPKAITTIILYGVRDGTTTPGEPNINETTSTYSNLDFLVQAYVAGAWTTLATYTSNNKLMVVTTVSLTAQDFRVYFTRCGDNSAHVIELEIIGPT